MRLLRANVKWYDTFFLSMLAISAIVVSISWGRYASCAYPLRIWIMVDYSAIFIFRMCMFVGNGLAAGLALNADHMQSSVRFYGRSVVLICLALVLYPFLWAWTIIGSFWFAGARTCIPDGQKYGFLVWLLFSYCGLVCIAWLATGKWLVRRQAHLQHAPQGSTISNWEVLIDLIQAPDWAYENAPPGHDLRGVSQELAIYHPGLFLTQQQREAVEGLIQQLPKFCLKTVPTECTDCPICLEEFHVDDEVRGLPCAHNFHVGCIDEWLRLNIKCPRCRCSVFPNLDLSAIGDSQHQRSQGVTSIYFGGGSGQDSVSTVNSSAAALYVRSQAATQRNHLLLQERVHTLRIENAGVNAIHDLVTTGHATQFDDTGSFHHDLLVVVERSPPSRF